MINRTVSRLRAGACMIGLFSFVFATAQTLPPPADDDSFPFAAVIKALTPVCSAFTATPASVLVGGQVALAATCTNSPTAYDWYRGTTLLTTTTTATYATTAPSTAATYEYSVVAKRGSIPSLKKSANVSVITAPPLTLSTVTSATVNTSVSIQGTFSAPANSASIRVSIGSNLLTTLPNVSGTFSTPWTPSQSGVYQVNVQAISNSNSQILASQFTDIVVADLPAATALAIPGTSTAGATAGSFAVGDSGAAQFSLPITIPPGTAGMQPSVSLNYSSQGGNGHVGVGFSLGGFSAVTRCPKTIAQDGAKAGINYDNDSQNDAYCIDGQRLVEISRSEAAGIRTVEYRTEIDRFDRVLSFEEVNPPIVRGPNNFRVFAKSGQIMEFGSRWWALNNGYAQNPLDPERVNSVRTWPLDRVKDRNGNYFDIDYAGAQAIQAAPLNTNFAPAAIAPIGSFPAGEIYPTQVLYTKNDAASAATANTNMVVFEYEDRPANDRHVLFDSGAGQHILTKRLKAIATYVDGSTLVRRYNLTYDAAPATTRSRLVSVEECAADGVCLPKTKFDWSTAATSFAGVNSGLVWGNGSDVRAFLEFTTADINGDGRSDLVRRYGNSPGGIQALIYNPLTSTLEDRRLCRNAPCGQPGAAEVAGPDQTVVTFMDVNGDGLADVVAHNPVSSGNMRICITQPAATFFLCNDFGPSVIPQVGTSYYLQGDFNGDGKIDLLVPITITRDASGNDEYQVWNLYNGSASGLSTVSTQIRTLIKTSGANNSYKVSNFLVGDFNGDGRADLIAKKSVDDCRLVIIENVILPPEENNNTCTSSGYPVTWRVFLSSSTADGQTTFTSSPREVLATNTLGKTKSSQVRALTLDFNGDGLSDLMSPVIPSGGMGIPATGESMNLCLSAGDGSFATETNGEAVVLQDRYTARSLCKTIKLPAPWSTTAFEDVRFGDFDGDGRTDMMVRHVGGCNGASGGCWNVCLSRTTTAITPVTTPPTAAGNNVVFECTPWVTSVNEAMENTKVGDFDGDGKTDMLSSVTAQTGVVMAFAGNSFAKTLPDQLTRITNGLGASTSLEYAPITDNSVYTKGTGDPGVNRVRIQSPMYVVKKTQSSNGIGGTFDTTYKYEDLIGATDGRGLMGFKKKIVEQYNGSATVRTETTYEQQDWWKAGRIKQVQKFVDNELLNQADNTYEAKTVAATGGKTLYQVYMTSGTERSWNKNTTGSALVALPYTVTQAPARVHGRLRQHRQRHRHHLRAQRCCQRLHQDHHQPVLG